MDKYEKTMMKIITMPFFLLSIFLPSANADNPLVPGAGMADPHIRIFNNKAYLYATRDADINSADWNMPDWKIWTSSNLIDWDLESTISPTDTYIGESRYCWAPDAVEKNGEYFFYFSNKNIDTGVMRSKHPGKGFKDALNKPLLPKNLTPIKEYDPSVLIDDDPDLSAYILFGHHRPTDKAYYFAIAKLAEDMISLAEEPREVKFTNIYPPNDKPTLHKHKDLYYLSAGAYYATASNVYGPYTYRGSSGDGKYGLTNQGHGNYFTWNNQWYQVWCQFIKNKFRESKMTYVHYTKNGRMISDTQFLDQHYETGVGQYSADWTRIEAEWYFASDSVEKSEGLNAGFVIDNVRDGGYLKFPRIKNFDDHNTVTFRTASVYPAKIELRMGSLQGRILASCDIKPTGSMQIYRNRSCQIKTTKGTQDIFLRFVGKGDTVVNLDWFAFSKKSDIDASPNIVPRRS